MTQPRVAVVTGANRGIGRAVTVALAAAGFTVAAAARDPATLADTVAEAAKAGGTAVPLGGDVCDEASVADLAAAAERLGPVHTVVANAGIAGPTAPLHEITLADWRETVATDLDGVFLTFRAFIPGLIQRRDGSLIAISSMTGKRPLHGRTPYAAAKMGVIGLVRTLAAELGPHQAAQRRQGGHLGPGRLLGDPAGRGLPGEHLVDPGSGDGAGADRVDPDAVRPEFGGERADQPDDAHLRRGVGGPAVQRALAGHRRDRDQAAVPALDHGRDERPEGEEHPVQVGGDRLPPVRQRDLVQRRRGPGDPGVGHHGTDRAELPGPAGQRRHRGLVAHVAAERDRRPAGLAGRRHRVRQAGRVAGPRGDGEPGAGQGHRDGAADPPVGAGDHGDRDVRSVHPVVPAARSAARIRSGVIGSSVRRTPSGASASLTAALMAAGAIIRPPSPPPLMPCGVYGDGVST